MIRLDAELAPQSLKPRLERLFELAAGKIRSLEKSWAAAPGAPVVTVMGLYTARRWTDWTLGFQFGSALLQFDATGESWFFDYGRAHTLRHMASHVSNVGGHDHGFNNISTYGNLLRLAREGKASVEEAEQQHYILALKVSGAVQAARWTQLEDGRGYIHSFQGPHSLFVDTLRTLRSLAAAHRLGHVLRGEADEKISLLQRLLHHASVTAEFAVFYGEGRDRFDVRGRVAHESLFNPQTGSYCCPSTQQGYSPFTTWTRGLAWAMLGFAEQLEFLATLPPGELELLGGQAAIEQILLRAAQATCDFYLEQTPTDGVPYWDTGAPGLVRLGDYQSKPSDPFNSYEPVDSSAAAIAAQGLWRLARYLTQSSKLPEQALRYRQAALVITRTLLDEPYLSTHPAHQGLILHSLYHYPKGWDYYIVQLVIYIILSPMATPRFSWMRRLILSGLLNNMLQVLRSLRPHEGGTGFVIVVDELQKVLFQFPPRAMDAPLEPAPGQDAEKAFGQVDPGGMRRGMVKVDLGMPPEPSLGGRALVDVQVVQDNVKLAVRVVPRHLVHETQEIDGGSSFHFGQNLAGGNFQGRQQGMGTVPDIFIGPTAGLLGPQRQERLGAIESLDARLLIYAQHQGLFRGIQVKPHHIQQLGFKVRIGTEGEGAQAMGLEAGSAQHALHGAAGQPDLAGQGAHTPAALKLRLLADPVLDPLPDLGAVFDGPAGARGVAQSVQAAGGKTPPPLTDGDWRKSQAQGDLLVRISVVGTQHDARPRGQTLRRGGSPHPILQLRLLHRIEHNLRGDSWHAPIVTSNHNIINNYSYDVLAWHERLQREASHETAETGPPLHRG